MSEDKDKKRDSVTEMIQSKFLDERKIFLWGEVSDRSARDPDGKAPLFEATDPRKEILSTSIPRVARSREAWRLFSTQCS